MDAFDRATRLYPALLVLLPVTACIAIFFDLDAWVRTVVAVAVAAGVHLVVIRIVRALGVRRQEHLWAVGGGNPTALRLRWSEATFEEVHADLHERVSIFTKVELPTREEEAADPAGALRRYHVAVERLRERTRSATDYPRVRAELINYGFARNCYGAKPLGIVVAAGELGVVVVLATLSATGAITVPPWQVATAGVVGVIALFGWIAAASPNLVKRESARYADALLAAADRF